MKTLIILVIVAACIWSGAMAQGWENEPYKPRPPGGIIDEPRRLPGGIIDEPRQIPDQRLCEGMERDRHPVLVDSKPLFRSGRQIYFDFDSDREYHCTIGRRPVYDSPELTADADPGNGGWFS